MTNIGPGFHPASLDKLLSQLAECAPAERINLREAVLAHGSGCIEPLVKLAQGQPALSGSIASWLGTLATRDRTTTVLVQPALRRIAAGLDGSIARDTLNRLTGVNTSAGAPRTRERPDKPWVPSAKYFEVRARVIQAAKDGRILNYSELETSRGVYGRYLGQLSKEEFDAGHPPISAIVVGKENQRPGEGFYPFMREIGFSQPGEKDEDVWQRAVAAVHDFWRGRS